MTQSTSQHAKLSPAEALYLEAAKAKPVGAGDWLADRQRAARSTFEATGLPHRRVEAFKYTDFRNFDRTGYPLAGAPRGVDPEPSFEGAREIVIENGVVPEGFAGEGYRVLSLREALISETSRLEGLLGEPLLVENALADLNMSLMDDGVVLIVEDGAKLTEPLHIRMVNSDEAPSSVFLRHVVILGKGAEATLYESCDSRNRKGEFLSSVTHLSLGDEAVFSHTRFDGGNDEALAFLLLSADLGHGSLLESNAVSLGSKASRIETQVRFGAEEGEAFLNGILIGSGRDHIDHTTYVRHDAPHCSASETYRSVLTDQAQGVFQGQISVAPLAQKTDSRMMARALLLSDNASMRAKPELEIYADDVKCAHGATVGSLDDEALFYMMSRGIPAAEARSLLINAFVDDVLSAVRNDETRAHMTTWLADKLEIVTRGGEDD